MKKLFFASIIFLLLSFISAKAEPSVSRGVEIIRQKSIFCKNTRLENTYTFSIKDFEQALGKSFDQIVIKAVPENCTLKFGVDEIVKNTVIPKNEISALRCIPHTPTDNVDISFNTTTDFTETDYTLRLCPHEQNCAPAPQSLETFAGIAVYGTFPSDRVKIVENTENGTLTLSGSTFIYTPHADFNGEDTFSYKTYTECGALSEEELVKIRVRRPYRNLYFSDMVSHPAHAYAIKLFEKGAFNVLPTDLPAFEPEKPLSRAVFTQWALCVLGIETEDKDFAKEVFANGENPEKAIDTAVDLGILRGEQVGNKSIISPDRPITLAEASVILCRILAPEKEAFADGGSWYTGALDYLENTVPLSSHLSPDTALTRADGALILGSLI